MGGAERSVDLIGDEVFVLDDLPEIRLVGSQALDDELSQCLSCGFESRLAVLAVASQLGDHRVVGLRDLARAVDAAVDTGATHLWFVVGGHLAWCRQEAIGGVFGVDTQLYGVALGLYGLLCPSHLLPSRDTNLFLNDVDARAHLCDGMLHLDAGVHFKEIEVQVLVDEKLHRACVAVTYGLAQLDGGFAQLLASVFSQRRRGRLLDDFLVAALYGTFTLMQMDDVAEVVGEHLHLDMARVLDVLLHEHRAVAKVFLRFARGPFQFVFQVLFLPYDVHAFAATACRRLDQDGIRQSVGLCHDVVVAAHGAEGDRDAVFYGHLSRFNLVTHQAHRLGVGADEDEVVGLACLHQLGALGEEAIARMDGVGTSIQSRIDDLTDVEVGVFQGAVAQGAGLVGHAPVKGVGVVVGKDGHGGDMQFA